MTYETKIQELENELAQRKEWMAAQWKSHEEMSKRNESKIVSYFQNRGVTYLLCNFRKEWTGTDSEFQLYSMEFRPDEGSWCSGIRLNIKLFADRVELKDYSYPSGSGTNAEAILNHFKNATNIVNAIVDGSLLVPIFASFETADKIACPFREEYEIENEIALQKELATRNELDIRPGRTLYLDTQGHLRRYGSYWRKVTITKINKKTVQYVVNYDDGRTSDVQVVPFDYRNFKTIEQYEAWQAERKARWSR